MKQTFFLCAVACALFSAAPIHAGENAAAAVCHRIADTYGVKDFDNVEAIRYTFNAMRPNGDTISRSWEWQPKTGEVTYHGMDANHQPMTRSYRRSDVSADTSGALKRIDQGFINDQYWLLFPFHLVWDSGVEYTLNGSQSLPIPPGTAQDMLVQYGAAGGYTPGDAYELFTDADNQIIQWIYHKGGNMQSTGAVTWQHNVHAGPIMVALEHYDADGKLRLWFSNVAVKVTGDDDWRKTK